MTYPFPPTSVDTEGAPPRPALFGEQDAEATILVPLARGQPDGTPPRSYPFGGTTRGTFPSDPYPGRTGRGGHPRLTRFGGRGER